MHLTLNDFCLTLRDADLSNAEKALAILWYHDYRKPDVSMTARALAKVIHEAGIGNPNPTALGEAIRKTGLALTSAYGVRLKHASRETIRAFLPVSIDGIQPRVNHSEGFLPEAVWIHTRGYVESVCRQLNGCFVAAYYDAASVMLRRLIETLIIEAYEHLGKDQEIKGADGNYYMLKDLVDRAVGVNGATGLNLGRDAKTTLRRVKEQGDRSAHNRRFNAVAADLKELQSGVRVTVQELIQVAALKRP